MLKPKLCECWDVEMPGMMSSDLLTVVRFGELDSWPQKGCLAFMDPRAPHLAWWLLRGSLLKAKTTDLLHIRVPGKQPGLNLVRQSQ